ncbi:xanthine dehydrogenase family protein [Pseudomaricurvus alkylphenolicus]|uniref:xanthine dehydrogenase family protein molybdopterin-binding subunit n=1 Tax=Pseudomaricurvus alkylphenolicus TaxID=1306991 RepID=UPI001420818F|nr:xanthine dehydrogenase family protein molybdopterin-binding subunit [Pseudomaricurvus alkylphenolicus]NIB38739.1 xanthine dehydrogenase family protein [Pseudomaricurvus alkylphenolicus]
MPESNSSQYVGSRVKRREDPRLLTGRGRYVDDIKVAGMLHIAFRRSDYSHARILSIDTSAAKASPGVVEVFTAKDIEGEFNPVLAQSRMRDYQPTIMQILAADKVRFVGEAVVAVVAESRYLAEDAAALVEIEYDELPLVTDPEQALINSSAKLHEQMDSNVLLQREFNRGDVDEAFYGASVYIKERFRFTRKTSLAMENRTYLAEYNSAEQALTLHTTSQVPGIIRDILVDALDIPGSHLRVVAPDVGGGFGGKTSLYPEEVLAPILAKKLERPVKWTGDRIEDLISTSQGFDEIIDAEIAVDREGRILGLRADVIGDVGAYSIYPWTAGIEPVQVVSFLPGPYKIENYHGRVRGVATSKPPTGPYRGVGRPVSTFVMERLVDMAARELQMDPREIRQRNLVQPHEFPYKAASGIVWDQSGFTQGLNGACEAIGYDGLRRTQAQARAQGRMVGIGIASFAELTGIGSRLSASPGMPINTGTETASISVDSTGGITARFGVTSYGQGLETSLAQVVADELNVEISQIRILQGDSAAVSHSTGSYASRGAVLGAGAAILACRALDQKLKAVAAILLSSSAEDILIRDGVFSGPGSDEKLTFKDLAKAYYSQMGLIPAPIRNEIGELSATQMYDPEWGTTSSATHIALVEIDPDTFKVKVDKYVVAEDCGQMLNPMIVDGQVHGGVAQGIGAALYEEMIYDEQGQNLTASLVDYVVPSATEIPRMDVVHLDLEKPKTLGGVRGMGEGGTIGAPAAIANAVADALAPLGQQVTTLPVTPQRIFELVQAAKANQ